MLKHNEKNIFFKPNIIVFCIYVLLTIVLTYPWIAKFTTHKLGDDIDGSMLVWNIWWVEKALTSARDSLLFSDYIFYPIGTSLTFHTLTLLNGIIAFPFLLITNNILLIFNILTFFTFVLSGFGTYLLVDYLVKNKFAAFFSGIVFAFCPSHFVKVSFINYLSTQWLPFYILFLIKSLEEEKSKYLNIFLASLFLLFNSLICEIYGLFAALFTFAYLSYYLIVKKDYELRKSGFIRCFAIFSLFLLFFSPILYSMAKFLLENGERVLFTTMENARFESVDLLAYFIPSLLHPFFGNFFSDLTKNFTGIFQEVTVFPGYVVIFLTLYCVLKIKREAIIKFWVLCLLVSVLLSLGPFLHIYVIERFLPFRISIPMPYLITFYTPFLSAVRIPARYGVIAMLFFAILSGYGFKILFSKIKKNYILWQWVVVILILFEYLTIPFPLISEMKIPSIYERIKDTPGDFSILHIPLGWRAKENLGYNFTRFQYYQTFHEKRILDGSLARIAKEDVAYFERIPIIKSIISLEYDYPLTSVAMEEDKKNVLEFLEFFNIRYIVLDEVYERVFTHLDEDSFQNLDKYINGIFPVRLIYENKKQNRIKIKDAYKKYKDSYKIETPRITPPKKDPFYGEITSLNTTFKVYEVKRGNSFKTIRINPVTEISNLYLAKGWSDVSKGSNGIKTMKGKSLLMVRFNNVTKKKLIFNAMPLKGLNDKNFELAIKLNGYKVSNILIKPGWTIYSIYLPEEFQRKGINKIEFLKIKPLQMKDILIGFEFFELNQDNAV